jgi:NAD(P)-dependent dehydrogenase (short-subunit alcohol dehydrogenase family)
VGRNPEHCEEARNVFKANGIVVNADATHESVAELAVKTCIQQFGGLDGLYHVAGGSGRKLGDGPLHEITIEGWKQTMEINLTSLMLSNRAVINHFMANRQAGAILNMSSVLGFSPSPKYFSTHAYATAKSAVIGLSKSLSAYYAPYNIRINVIAPGLIETPMSQRAVNDDAIIEFIRSKQPLDGGRVGIPRDAAGAAVFLLSDHSKFISGQVLAVDGGWTVTEGQY